MPNSLKNTAATLTPPGRGAIGVIRLDGPGCKTALQALFRPASNRQDSWLEKFSKNRNLIRYGKWTIHADSTEGEDVILVSLDNQTFEIHSHGGPQSRDFILRSLQPFGFQIQSTTRHEDVHRVERGANPRAPIRDSFGNDFPWPGQFGQELGLQLLDCPTERLARLLLQQPANWKAWIERTKILVDRNAALEMEKELSNVKKWNPLAQRLANGWNVVLAGPPNSGKSSLLNALSGFSRAIVHESPGTTRDVVTQSIFLNGWPFQLADTAGQRETNSPVEMQGIRLGTSAWLRADCRVAVFDGTQQWGDSQQELLAILQPILLVLNKSDLNPNRQLFPHGIWLSAKTSDNLTELVDAIIAATIPEAPTNDSVLAFSERLRKCLETLEKALLLRNWLRIGDLLEELRADAGL